jgi:GH25 family lysozyme M1 (1,4-beta-N-acetylmuramidase)
MAGKRMKLPDDEKGKSELSPSLIATIVTVGLIVGVLLLVVLLINQDVLGTNRRSQGSTPSNLVKEPSQGEDEDLIRRSLTPDELDFWDLYPTTQPTDSTQSTEATPETTPPTDDPSTDGRHTLVVHDNGKEEWVLISPYLPKHQYDYTNLVSKSGMMQYFKNARQISYLGVDVSETQDYIDFILVKKAGIDFVMIRVGVRGYGTGQLRMDEYFTDNYKRATDAGLEVGVYFESQAITEDEAIEEANLVITSVSQNGLSYPVAYVMEYAENDTSRVEELTRQDKTKIAKAFLETIDTAGYTPMLYGNKEWLISRYDMTKLMDFDVWLAQEADLPDYPYWFNMWQYNTTARISGIASNVGLNISFIDYSEK